MNFKLRLLCLLVALAPINFDSDIHGVAGLPIPSHLDSVLFHDETYNGAISPFLNETPAITSILNTSQRQSKPETTTTTNTTIDNKHSLSKRSELKESSIPKTKSATSSSSSSKHSKNDKEDDKDDDDKDDDDDDDDHVDADHHTVTAHAASKSGASHGSQNKQEEHESEEAHHLVFNPSEMSSTVYFAVVCITGILNIVAGIYVIRHTHPLRKTKKAADTAAKRQTILQSAASAVRRTMHQIPAPWMLEQQFHAGRLTKKEREEVRRHEDHKLAFFTTTTDLMVTILITTTICYSYFTGALVDGLPCELIGFAVFSLLLMDITLSLATLRYGPWVLAAILFPFEAFGQDEFWCFAQVGHKSGKFALATTVLFHYTILLIVLMCFIPIMRVSRHQRKYGTNNTRAKLSAHEVASNQSNAKHMLVHILHYTPGTLHSIATLCNATSAELFIFGVAFVQLGAVMHAALIWSHERHRRIARQRRGTGDSWANPTFYQRSNTMDSQRTMVSSRNASISQKVLSTNKSNTTLPAHLIMGKPTVHFSPPKPVAVRPSLSRETTRTSPLIARQTIPEERTTPTTCTMNGNRIQRTGEADVEYGDFLNDYIATAMETSHSECRPPAGNIASPRRGSVQFTYNDARSTHIPYSTSNYPVRKVYTAEPLPMDAYDRVRPEMPRSLPLNVTRHFPRSDSLSRNASGRNH
ncbi:hypothetical protein BDF22DRAFT_741202 [Syncephalis plumigaleata]|nr:hypothetical protein BDF22DRAFT_741202 [Syncephalis plumigaleata]